MQLTNIINQVPDILEAGGDLKTEVTGISYDSRQVQQGHLFIAVRGLITDGHDFIYTAIENGAQVIVYDRSDFVIPENIVSILVQE